MPTSLEVALAVHTQRGENYMRTRQGIHAHTTASQSSPGKMSFGSLNL